MVTKIDKLSSWLGLIGAVVAIAGAIVGGALWIVRGFNDLGNRMVEIQKSEDARIAKLEVALRVLSSEQPDKTKQLVKELLAERRSQQQENPPAVVAFSHTHSHSMEALRKQPSLSVGGEIAAGVADTPAAPPPAAAIAEVPTDKAKKGSAHIAAASK